MLIDILGAIVVVLCGGRFRIPPTGSCHECGLPDVLSNLSPFPFHPPKSHKHKMVTNCVQVEIVQEPKLCWLRGSARALVQALVTRTSPHPPKTHKHTRRLLCKIVTRCEQIETCIDCVVVHAHLCKHWSRAHQNNCRVRVQAFVQASWIMIYVTTGAIIVKHLDAKESNLWANLCHCVCVCFIF